MRPSIGLCFGLCLCLELSTAAATQDPLAQRLTAVRALIASQPRGMKAIFAGSFLQAVPATRLAQVLRTYHKQGGAVRSVIKVASRGPYWGEYRFFTRRSVFPVKLGVSAEPPHKVTTLWFGVQAPRFRTLTQAATALRQLPGKVSFAVYSLGAKRPRLLEGVNPQLQLAIGSSFKLYVLGALLQAVAAGKRRWDEVVPLREAWRSWPSGMLQDWPTGTPVTLATLAQLMIAISDNTATDHLLHTLGRAQVEQVQRAMGHARPGRNVPFLTTREMFLLKETGHAATRTAAYLRRNVAGRRAYLERTLAQLPGGAFAGIELERPTAIDALEWFASAADLCRALDWLRRNAPADRRALLTVNNGGLALSSKRWPFVGYKGGSEPGVLNLSWLLRRSDGRWFAISAGWNNPRALVKEKRLLELVQGAALVLEGR